jgi:hypothetical protein
MGSTVGVNCRRPGGAQCEQRQHGQAHRRIWSSRLRTPNSTRLSEKGRGGEEGSHQTGLGVRVGSYEGVRQMFAFKMDYKIRKW